MSLDREIRLALIHGTDDDALNAAWAALDFVNDLERPTLGGQEPAVWVRAVTLEIRTRMARAIHLTEEV